MIRKGADEAAYLGRYREVHQRVTQPKHGKHPPSIPESHERVRGWEGK